jgi:hypothetical protein
MANYVLSFRGRNDRTPSTDEEAAWAKWFQEIGGSITDFGNRVGRVKTLGRSGADAPGQEVLAGYVVIDADHLDAAVALANGCPGLKHGAVVEVGEPVPAS